VLVSGQAWSAAGHHCAPTAGDLHRATAADRRRQRGVGMVHLVDQIRRQVIETRRVFTAPGTIVTARHLQWHPMRRYVR
jgi:hypothetical protein